MLGVLQTLLPHLWYLLEGQKEKKEKDKQICIIYLTVLVITQMVEK